MDKMNEVSILASVTDDDKEWLRELWLREWGGEIVISKGQTYHVQDTAALIAWCEGVRVGAVAYHVRDEECELISLNATVEGLGIGSKLMTAVAQTVQPLGVNRIWLITTNDNINALRFYQKQGYRITAVYPNTVDEARKLKPTIPHIGNHDIPIHDEIELEIRL
ncbi:GNAT family N-acetyltransferase [Paenibacillus sp. R14(2021)]|uniref:GNAT family N-acetyltransferase n=1 Tax=Paenibacillus sp. R14(2021) TaxID=2859228 RepID=UPI001C61675B|nr:GNAT family N-acetyltransferase [Paenibacillus sp. R14(2021)]